MSSNSKKMKLISLLLLFFVSSISFSKSLYAVESDAKYLIDGKVAPYWTAAVGNALEYGIKLENQKAKTKRSNLVVTPSKKETKGDALKIKWKGKVIKNQWGSGNILHDSEFSIGGPKTDLSFYAETHAIVLDIKVNKPPKALTKFTIECNWSNHCRPSIPINSALRKLPQKEWVKFPIPLACFNQDNFDFSQLTSIVKISTQGALNIELANVYLAELPEGQRGCR